MTCKVGLHYLSVAPVAGEPHTRTECQSSPYYQNTALYPIVDFLETRAGFLPDDPAEAKEVKPR